MIFPRNFGQIAESHYDRRGFRDLMRWREADGVVRDHGVAVDTRGRVTAASLPGAQVFAFSYTANDLVKDVLRSNGTLTQYGYEPTGEIKTASVASVQGEIEDFAYYYTPSGQMQARTDHEGTHSYGYTPTYRLAQVQNPAGSLLANEEFSYDAVGNRTNASGVSYNVNNQMAGTGITFDANGNLTAKGGATFAWDMKNRLRTFDNGTDTEASYVYDPFGRRIKKTVTISGVATTTYFLWDGDQLLAEYNGSGALTKRYAYLGGYAPVQMVDVSGTSETIYDVHTDHLDTPKFLTNAQGQVVWRATHKAYGEAMVNEDTDGNGTSVKFNLRFPGQYYDQESGLHYNRFRYYDTNMGRYITADPIGQRGGVNIFSYAMHDPLRYVDPDGRDFHEKVRAILNAGPYDAYRAGTTIRDQAKDVAEKSNLPGAHNGAQDAYRHCVWVCEMSKQINKEDASQVAAEHEQAGARATLPQPDAERKMDEANNRAGLQCAEKPENCAESCMDRLANGELFGPGGASMSPPSTTPPPPSNPGPVYK